MSNNNLIEVIKKRRSIRLFQNKEISNQMINEIIDCARLAPTARNLQPWKFVVVKKNETLRKISEATDYGKFLKDAAACILVFCEDTKYYLEDGCAATENILLASYALGIGSCWIAGDKKPYVSVISKIIGVSDGWKLVSIVALGYPAENPFPPKKTVEQVIKWEHW